MSYSIKPKPKPKPIHMPKDIEYFFLLIRQVTLNGINHKAAEAINKVHGYECTRTYYLYRLYSYNIMFYDFKIKSNGSNDYLRSCKI